MDDNSQPMVEQKHPISIATLFYLVTLSAIVATCARYLELDEVDKVPISGVVGLLVGGAVFGLIVGSIVAIQRPFYRWLSPLFGVLVGCVASPLLLIPIDNYRHILTISFVGCWILIVFSLVVARLRDDPTISRRN